MSKPASSQDIEPWSRVRTSVPRRILNRLRCGSLRPISYSLACSLVLLACGADDEAAGTGAPESDAGIPTADVVYSDDTAGGGCESPEPGVDSDEDGILDILEDANRDCSVDSDETDPFSVDSDGDGLDDGFEDLDRNGRHDAERGEFDPRQIDTDGDGISDSDETASLVCTPQWLSELDEFRYAVTSEHLVFVDPEDEVFSVDEGRAALVLDTVEQQAAAFFWIEDDGSQLSYEEVLAGLDQAAGVVGGTLSIVAESRLEESLGWSVDLTVELEEEASSLQLLSALAEGLGIEPPDLPLSSFDAQVLHRFQLEIEVNEDGLLVGRTALAVSSAFDPTPWFDRHGISAVAPAGAGLPRPHCVEFDAAAGRPLDLVIALDTHTSLNVAQDALAPALSAFIDFRGSQGLTTRAWIVPGDAHRTSSTGVPLNSEPIIGNEVFELLDSVQAGGADQRLWRNTLEFLQLQSEMDDNAEDASDERQLVVLFVAGREDTEFRQGTTDGYDGAPDGEVLAGEERDALIAFYEYALSEHQPLILTTSISPLVENESCPLLTNRERGSDMVLTPDAGGSYRKVAIDADGAFFEICNPDLQRSLTEGLIAVTEAAGNAQLELTPIAGTTRVAADGEIVEEAAVALENVDGGARVRLGNPTEDGAAAFLVWGSSSSTSGW